MKNWKKRLIALFMAIALVVTMFPNSMGVSEVEAAQTVDGTLEFAYRWGNENTLQVNTTLPSTTPCANFLAGDNGCEIDQSLNQYQQVGWIGMDNVDGTIVLTFHFGSAFEKGQTYILPKGAIFGFTDGKTYALDKDYTFTFNGTDWKDPEPEPEPTPEVTFEYRSGNAEYIQVNTSLPADTPLENFTAGDNGCALDETQNQYQNVGWIGMDNADGVIVLTFHFNKAFEKDQTYVIAKDSIFGFTDGKSYKLDKDYTFTFYGTDWVKPAEHIHKYDKSIVKATTTKAGSITEACACGDVKSKTVIPAASKISLSKTAVSYNKKTQKVTVSVKDSKGKALAASQYSVSGTVSAKKVGTYKVKVTLKGNYMGSTTLTWKINPNATKVSSVKAGKKSLTVTWKKQSTETTGYKIQVSTDKNFKKSVKTVTISKNKTTSKKITGLKKNKKYYVRICTYKGSNTSAWTKYSKSVKVK